MKGLVAFDHALTERIRAWGKAWFGFWKFMAARSIALFPIAALALSLTEQLVWWHYVLAFVTAYLVSNGLQRLVKRHRPDFAHLTGYKMLVHSYSYPSMHSAMSSSSAVALILMSDFSTPTMATITTVGAIALAFLIGVSRIVVGVHYCADVIFGWLVGFVIALGYVLLLVV